MGCASSKEDDPRDLLVFTAPQQQHNDDDRASRADHLTNPWRDEGVATAAPTRRDGRHVAAPDSPGTLLAAQAAVGPSPASLAAASLPNTPARGLGNTFEGEPASDDDSDSALPDAYGHVASAEEDTPSVAATLQPGCAAAARPNPRSGLARKLSLRNVKTVVATANPLAGIDVDAADAADFDPPEVGSTHSDVSSRSVKSRVDAGGLSGMQRFEALATLPAPAAGSATTIVATGGSNTTAAATTAAAASATSGLASSRRWAEDDDEPASAVAMSLLGSAAAAAAARSNKPPLAGGARQPFAPPKPSVAVQRLRSCDLRIPSEPKIDTAFAFELPRAAVDAAPGTGMPPAKSKFLRAGDAFKKRGVPSPENTPPALRSGTATCDTPACIRSVGIEEEDAAVSPESEMVLSFHPQLSDIIRNASAATRRQWAEAKLREPAPLLSNVKLRRVEEWLASLGRAPAPVPQLGGPGARPVGLSPRNLSRNASILLGMEGRRTCSTSISNSVDGDIARRRQSSARTRSSAGPFASATTTMAVAEYQLDGVPDASTDALQREIAALADSKLVQSTMGFSRDSVKGSQCPADPPLSGPPLVQ